jgi:hypothetical protein
LITLILLAAAVAAAEPAQDRAWLNLLHFKNGKSQAMGEQFWLSKERTPQAELEATLKADPETLCRFPARAHYLGLKLGSCPRFEQWRDTIDAEGVSVIFADAFLNNPSSMYGHTFLRLRRRGQQPGILDYTINYAGKPDTDNGILYAVRGVFGLFPGSYATHPYYMKVQEYNSLESRDLWEYDLALSSEAVAQLIRHAWEMGSTEFPYYFFSENCSYQLLTLLDAAEPSLGLSDQFGFGTVPGDTVRAILAKPGLVSGTRYRPSHVKEMLARRAALTKQERDDATKIGRRQLVASSAGALDAGYDYLKYREGFSDKPDAYERSLLIARGRLGAPPTEARTHGSPVEAGHRTARLGLGAGASTFGPWQELSWRGALHDLPADPRGYAEASQLEMANFRLRFDGKNRRPYLESAKLVDIVSLSPWDSWVKKHSWRVSFGAEQAKEFGRRPADSMASDLSGGFGLAFQAEIPARPLFYVFAEGAFGAGPVMPRGWRVGGGGSAGLLLRPVRGWRLLLDGTWREFGQRSPHQERLRLISSWTLARDWELRATLDRRTPDSEAGATLLFHY